MAFGFNSFSETPYAAIVENPIVAVTGQELTIAETSPGVIIDVTVSLTGQDLTTNSTTQVTETSTYNNVRSRSRQLVFRFESDDDSASNNQLGYKWRLGSTRIDIQPSGRRA